MPQMMANAMPAALPVMHGGGAASRGSVYKYGPAAAMTMHNAQQQQPQQQHVYQQTVVQQQPVPPATVANRPPVVSYCDNFHCFMVVTGSKGQ